MDEPCIPSGLVAEIRGGRCVAFVGAGFTGAAGLPSWSSLLREVADKPEVGARLRAYVTGRLEEGTAHAFDEIAQVLRDALGHAALTAHLVARDVGVPRLEREAEVGAERERHRGQLAIGACSRTIPFRTGPSPSPARETRAHRQVSRGLAKPDTVIPSLDHCCRLDSDLVSRAGARPRPPDHSCRLHEIARVTAGRRRRYRVDTSTSVGLSGRSAEAAPHHP